jgi:hypothetical protein
MAHILRSQKTRHILLSFRHEVYCIAAANKSYNSKAFVFHYFHFFPFYHQTLAES